MGIFNLELMKKGYFDAESFDNGYSLFNRKAVKLEKVDMDMLTDHYRVEAKVNCGIGEVKTNIEFKENNQKGYCILVGDRECSCLEHQQTHKNCEHMAAIILHTNNYTLDELIDGNSEENNITSPEIFEFEELFLRDYEEEFKKIEKVDIEPIVEMCDNEFKIYFKIGTIGKLKYIIRDIFSFQEMFVNKETFEYGKLFTFTHSINNFTSESQDIVSLTLDLISTKTPLKDRKYITLNIAEFANFLSLYKSKTLMFKKEHSPESKYQVVEGVMPFELNIIQDENTYVLQIKQLVKFTKFAPTGILIIDDAELSFLKIKDNKVYELLKILHIRDLKISHDDIFSFYDNVIDEISKHINVNTNFDIEKMYDNVNDFQLYIEKLDKGDIRVNIYLSDGEISTPFIANKLNGINYSKADEIKLMNLLDYYGKRVENSFIISDSQKIYEFMSEGIFDINKVFDDITLENSFKEMKIINRNKIKVGVSVSNNLLDVQIDLQDIDRDELKKILTSYENKKEFIRLNNGNFLDLKSEFVHELNGLMNNLGITKEEIGENEIYVPHFRALYLDHVDELSKNISLIRDESFEEIVRKVDEIKKIKIPIPKDLNATLKPYQIEGYQFLKTMEHLNFGCILADDMGLGKTIQVITTILSSERVKPSLIVCPSSLILNWEKEFNKFAPSLDIICINEDGETREAKIRNNIKNQIVITSYELLKRDLELYREFEFDFFVIDEAHYIKNNSTQNFKSVKQIRADHNIALTGTPIENSLSELWSLFDFVVPGYLGSYYSFNKRYETPIVKENNELVLNDLRALVKPFILRRLKVDVLDDLPEKNEEFLYVKMNEEHQKIYDANLLEIKEKISNQTTRDFNSSKLIILSMLTKLRQLACDPRLIYPDYDAGSAKVDLAVDIIKKSIANNQKTLLFSQFTSMLELIEKRLQDEGIDYYLLKGSTKKSFRHEMTESFNHDDTMVFLISLKAGGTGLNLVGANTVIHFDPWWNMSAQNQATDRVYRIGQEQNVTVYKLLTTTTIEEKIVNLQNKKSELANTMLAKTNEAITKMTKEEILELFE